MRELFIYWRTADIEAAERAAAQWQAELRREYPALVAALYRRSDEAMSGLGTVMETYAGPALDAALEHRIETEGSIRLGPWLAGPRKIEVFVRAPPA